MKRTHQNILPLFTFVTLLFLSSCFRDKQASNTGSTGADYFPVKEYTLKNGLKVFITVNKTAPRIQTAITVKAGSKYDPPQTTGLAHYLEHMLFKGSHQFGTVNYDKEKPYLDSISALFEQRKNEPDAEKKKAIYSRIDSFSYEASKWAIPNEYDKMVSSIGAKGTNAFTDRDLTCYVNDIPSNALDKWLFMESDRFQNLTLRIFHTELEAVYEEFNISTSYDQEWSSQAVDSLLMPNHPYGSQTTIGLSEHLKNPSLINIQNYFNTYYVPNNCAIVLSGDLDPDKTIALIEKYFGSWKAKEVPKFVREEPIKITQPLYTEKKGQEPEHVYVGFRFDGANTRDPLYVKLVDAILANGKGSGLIDLNLKLSQKVLDAYSTFSDNKDYTIQKLYGQPKEGQKLEEVKDLLLAQIDSVKQGNFPDWLLKAVIDNMKYDMIKQAETNQGRTFDIVFAFVKDISLEDRKKEIAELSKITKADIIKFAKDHYGNNYAVCYKRMGEPSLYKVEKPKITPVVLNKDSISAFRKQFDAMAESKQEPKFCDFDKEIKHTQLNHNVRLDYVHNDLNKTFKLNYIFDMGTDNDSLLGLAIDFLPYMGTKKYNAAALKQEFYKLGLVFDVSSSRDQVYISLSGLEKNLNEGITLFEHVLSECTADQNVYNEFAQNVIKKRLDVKLDKDAILWEGLFNYGKYGAKNPNNDIVSNDALTKLDANTLSAIIHQLSKYKHKIFYYGQNDIEVVRTILNELHKTNASLKNYPTAKVYAEATYEKPVVYFCNYNMKQAQIVMLSKGDLFNESIVPVVSMFNEYYGGSMASVIFQEIREKMALAYSAFGNYSIPQKKDESHYVFAFVGTQADKLPTAVDKMTELLNDLPEAQAQFDMSQQSLIKRLESDWTTNDKVYWAYQTALKRGLNYDIKKEIYEKAKNIKYAEVKSFFNANVSHRQYVYLVVGNKGDIDMNALAKMGEIKELSLTEVFGY